MEGYGRVWKGMEGYGRVWKGMEGYGMVWKGMEGYGRVWKGIEGYGKVWKGIEGYGRVWNELGRAMENTRTPCWLYALSLSMKLELSPILSLVPSSGQAGSRVCCSTVKTLYVFESQRR
jgi:hypothetical protein